MGIRSRIRRVLGVGEDRIEKARDGAYWHVFCPHCAALIPSQYEPLTPAERLELGLEPPDAHGMTFVCPNCDRRGVVVHDRSDLEDDKRG